MKNKMTRGQFIQRSVFAGIGLTAIKYNPSWDKSLKSEMKFGLVTYQWGKDWDLPTLISNCVKTGFLGVELRTQHAHKVETSLNAAQRNEVKKRFADSSIVCVGYGSNFEFHSPDPKILRQNIDQTKEYIRLCKDIGASGIKVKPNNIPKEVPKEKTISQIASSLNEVGKYASDFGLKVRLEVHGTLTQEIPNIKAIMEEVSEPNVKICLNSNDTDLLPPGLEVNFASVKKWIGDTVHIRELGITNYPYKQLFNFLAGNNYNGWILLEASTEPKDRIVAMKDQINQFNQIIADLKIK
jgi:hydroxypyruvate isomerase